MTDCMYPNRQASTGYVYGCRCSRCKGWNSEYQRRFRQANPDYQREYHANGREPAQRRNQRRIQGDYHGPAVPKMNSVGYWYTRWRWHPLAYANGLLLIHRANLYAEIGPGPHECAVCGRSIDWGAGLVVDHVDHDKSNNHPSNLRPLCQGCNTAHG